jgi:ribosome-binding protein aMBF1 (putative translation factor)
MKFNNVFLRQRREELGLSQTALAAKIKSKHSNVSQWENGKHCPNPTTRTKLATALKCKPGDFVMREEGT